MSDYLSYRIERSVTYGLVALALVGCLSANQISESQPDDKAIASEVFNKETEQNETLKWRADVFERNGYEASGITEQIKRGAVGYKIGMDTYGSGTLVKYHGEVILITAKHVLSRHKDNNFQIKMWNYNGDESMVGSSGLIEGDKEDIALVRVESNGEKLATLDFEELDFETPQVNYEWSGIFFPIAADGKAVPVSPPIKLNLDGGYNLKEYVDGLYGFDSLTGPGGSGAGMYSNGKLGAVLVARQKYEPGTGLDQQKRSYVLHLGRIGKTRFEDLAGRVLK